MWYVYIIRSINFPDQEYTGASEDLRRRLKDHRSPSPVSLFDHAAALIAARSKSLLVKAAKLLLNCSVLSALGGYCL